MDTQLVQTSPNTALAAHPDYVPVAGFGDLGADDFTLPTLKLVQAQTKDNGAENFPGQYLKVDTSEYIAKPNVLVVGIAKSRVMFPPKFSADSKEPLCRSDDAQFPRNEFVGLAIEGVTIPAACEFCAHSQWPDSGDAPLCSLTENWAAILDSGEPVILRLRGSSASTSKVLKNMMRANRLRRVPTYITLGSRMENNAKGRYYVATVTPNSAPIPEPAIAFARMVEGVNLAARAADEQAEQARAVGRQDEAPPPDEEEDLPF